MMFKFSIEKSIADSMTDFVKAAWDQVKWTRSATKFDSEGEKLLDNLPVDLQEILGSNRDFEETFTTYLSATLEEYDDTAITTVRREVAALVQRLITFKAPMEVQNHMVASYKLMARNWHEGQVALALSIATMPEAS